MKKLSEHQAKRCITASGWLLHEGKILLIKHKLLGIWLSPGGHVEEHELLHHAAEREFFEETGVHVQAISAVPLFDGEKSEFLPLPFISNLHWINEPGSIPRVSPSSGKTCEQHCNFSYFVACEKIDELVFGDAGIEDIRWFSEEEIETLETNEDIKKEARFVFKNHPKK